MAKIILNNLENYVILYLIKVLCEIQSTNANDINKNHVKKPVSKIVND